MGLYIRRSAKMNMTMAFLRTGSWSPDTMCIGRMIMMMSLTMSTMLAASQNGN